MPRNIKSILISLALLYLSNINKVHAADSLSISIDSIDNIVYLIGDAGESNQNAEKVLNELVKQSNAQGTKNTIIFLGDNIYPGGIPLAHEKGVEEAKALIAHQLEVIKKADAKIYFIPGNHDWNRGKKDGLSHVINEGNFINETLGYKSFLLKNGCPGPKEIQVSDQLTLIAIDTQWWLHQFEKGPINTGDCKYSTPKEITDEIKDILDNNKGKNVLIVGHHPIYSNGEHGGYFSLKNHLFPFTNLNKNLYLPLPIIGSIYPFARSNIGNIQDIHHPEYQTMINNLWFYRI